MNQQIQDINIDKIKLDFRNPRISEFGVNQGASDTKNPLGGNGSK